MAQRGFTLIELLVVMVLLGLLAGIAVTTVGGGNQNRELANEVNRFHAVLRMAAEEAIFNNEEIGVIVDSDLYEFVVYDEKERSWVYAEQSFLRSYTLPEWISMDFQREGKERKILGESEEESEYRGFDYGEEEGVGDNSRNDESDKDAPKKSTKKPQLMLLSSGEVTGFVIGLQIEDESDSRLEIKTNTQGEIILPHVEELEES